MAEKPLLDLDTLFRRSSIAVDGTAYELFSPDELSVMASHQFGVWGRRIEALAQSESEEDGALLEELMNKAARAAFVDLPAAVFDKLTGAQKMAIVDVFTGLLLQSKLRVAGAIGAAAGLPIGGTSFPGSPAPLAGRLASGFMKRLRRFFGRI